LLQGTLLTYFPMVLDERLEAEVRDSTATISLFNDFFISF